MFIDSHCHINAAEFAGREPEILKNMQLAKVTHALCVAISLPTVPSVLDLANRNPNIYASVGVHPDFEDEQCPTEDQLLGLADHPKVVAIGETGLDYFRLEGDLEWQRTRFRTHIRAARRCHKPLIVHTRESAADTVAILEQESAGEVGGVMHCFTESLETAKAAIDLNFMISFSGIVTFRNAQALRDVVKAIPLEYLLIETDSPYLAPAPYRGKTNQPAYVIHVAEEIARIKNLTVEEIGRITTANFCRLFKLPDLTKATP